jgi:hypothetical protein
MWHEGTIGIPVDGKMISYKYWVKVYSEKSEAYGLDGGRISKVRIKVNGVFTCNYERGWNQKPSDEATEIALTILRKKYN